MNRMHVVGAALALVLGMAAAPAAHAGLEPVLGTCGASPCLWQEPAVTAPKGWVLKDPASRRYHARAFAPAGSNFENATAVMYAKAVPKQGQPATLDGFVSQDVASFRAQNARLQVKTGLSFADGDGRRLKAVQLLPGSGGGQWETIAYGEDGDFYLVFALSATGVVEQQAAEPAFAQMVASYHAGRGAPGH